MKTLGQEAWEAYIAATGIERDLGKYEPEWRVMSIYYEAAWEAAAEAVALRVAWEGLVSDIKVINERPNTRHIEQ